MVDCRRLDPDLFILFICDLCYATKDSAKSDLGTFKTCRTLEETKQIADLLHCNPNKLTQSQLSAVAKGVKTHPVLNIEHAEHKVDATQKSSAISF